MAKPTELHHHNDIPDRDPNMLAAVTDRVRELAPAWHLTPETLVDHVAEAVKTAFHERDAEPGESLFYFTCDAGPTTVSRLGCVDGGLVMLVRDYKVAGPWLLLFVKVSQARAWVTPEVQLLTAVRRGANRAHDLLIAAFGDDGRRVPGKVKVHAGLRVSVSVRDRGVELALFAGPGRDALEVV